MRPEVQTLIPLFIALPLTVSVLIQLFARRRAVLAGWMACLAMLAQMLMALATIGQTTGGEIIYNMGGWKTPFGIDLRMDSLTTLLVVTTSRVSTATSHG